MRRILLPFSLTLALLVVLTAGCSDEITSSNFSSEGAGPAGDGSTESSDPSEYYVKGGQIQNFIAPLSGRDEVDPVETRATGLAQMQLNKDGDELSFKLIASNIEGATQAHIHCGAADVNGPVVAFLYGFNAAGTDNNGILSEGTITASNVIPRPDSPECPDGVANFEEMLAKMASGDAYVNVHTLDNPGGEIRGQITRGNGVNR